jgi:hypothetical protein
VPRVAVRRIDRPRFFADSHRVIKHLGFLALGLTFTLSVWAGCSGGGGGGTGGATSTTSVTHSTVGVGGSGGGGIGGGNACVVQDGICDLKAGEDCGCADCTDTAFCTPDLCMDPTNCDHLFDSCTCPACAEDPYCGDPAKGNCKDDGMCDSYVEGCHCADCQDKPECAPRITACAGGKADGICDRSQEDCSCVDCEGTPLCVPCTVDGVCSDSDPCTCSDCIGAMVCNDPSRCEDDGVCAAVSEGCVCNDCKGLPECQPGLDAGTPDAGDGG